MVSSYARTVVGSGARDSDALRDDHQLMCNGCGQVSYEFIEFYSYILTICRKLLVYDTSVAIALRYQEHTIWLGHYTLHRRARAYKLIISARIVKVIRTAYTIQCMYSSSFLGQFSIRSNSRSPCYPFCTLLSHVSS